MEESRTKYILLKDRVGDKVERNILSLGLSTKKSPIQVLRGELLEAIPELEQPQNSHQIALVGLDREKLRLVCPTEDLTRLSDEEANLLLAISPLDERYDIFIDKKRFDMGRRIQPGTRVFVKVKRVTKDLLGVVWYKGELPPNLGTMFGVELIENPGQGTTDGMFRDTRYFTCGKDSGLFVALNKIRLNDSDNKSPKSPNKEENALSNVATRPYKETVLQPFLKGKNEMKQSQGAMETILHMGQRVVTYIDEKPVGGIVRYIGEEKDRSGYSCTMVGLELDSRLGRGSGALNGKQRFFCRRDYACLLPIESVIPEKDFDFDSNPQGWRRTKGQEALQPFKDEGMAKSLSYNVNTPGRGKNEMKQSQGAVETILHMDQRVVTFTDDKPVRGIVRYIGEEKDGSGRPFTVVGLELDSRLGRGIGQLNGKQRFVCRRDFACFLPIESVIPEKDFDSNPQRWRRTKGQEALQPFKDGGMAKSLSYNVNTPGRGGRWRSFPRRSNSFDLSAEAIMAAGQSSKTNLDAFIEKQRQILMECNRAKNQAHEEGDVNMRGQERKTMHADFVNINPHCYEEREHQVLARGMSQNPVSPGPQLSRCSDKFTSTGPGIERTKSAASVDEVVVDCDANSDQKVDHHLPREPDEHMDTQSDTLHAEATGLDNTECGRDSPNGRELPRQAERYNMVEQPASELAAEKLKTKQFEMRKEQLEEELIDLQDQLREKEEHEADLQERLKQKEEQETSLQDQLREKEERETDLQDQLIQKEERETSLQERLRQKEHQETSLQERLREKERQEASLQEQLRQKEEQEIGLQERLREKEELETSLQERLREKERQEASLQERLRQKEEQEANLREQLREREEQETNSQERLRDKEEQEADLQEQLREREEQKADLQERLRQKEQQETNLQQRMIQKEQEENNLQERLRQKEEQEANLQEELRQKVERETDLQEQLREKEHQEANLQRQLRGKEQDVQELEVTLSAAQQTLNEQRHQEPCDWVISQDEIHVTEKRLGTGGWGSVVEGTFRGYKVAVKQIHELILSPHNRLLFEREMNMASRCRHPCLLQFIGATNDDGSPMFVTELMETSLRALLEQRALSQTEIFAISLDVAHALNYLHLNRPSPIIHRDISSANVLLWRQGDQWRGKVSDYGTANFMRHTMTVAPGAAIYCAPEALTSRQSTKVDVYSFGVLLCELCIREMPDPQRRDQQIALVTSRMLRGLIRHCVHSEPGTRPTMEEISGELEQYGAPL